MYVTQFTKGIFYVLSFKTLLFILIITSTGQCYMCVIQQKVNSPLSLRPLSLDCLTSTSAHGQVLFTFLHLPMTSSHLAVFHHILFWLMSSAMGSVALCDICVGENSTNGCHLAVFSVDVDYACHFMATHQPPLSHPIEVLLASLMNQLVYILYSTKLSNKYLLLLLKHACWDSKAIIT